MNVEIGKGATTSTRVCKRYKKQMLVDVNVNIIRLFTILNALDKVGRAFKKKRTGGLGTETNTCMSEVLDLFVEALIPLRHEAVNGCLVKLSGLSCEPVQHVVVRGESFATQSLFMGPNMA